MLTGVAVGLLDVGRHGLIPLSILETLESIFSVWSLDAMDSRVGARLIGLSHWLGSRDSMYLCSVFNDFSNKEILFSTSASLPSISCLEEHACTATQRDRRDKSRRRSPRQHRGPSQATPRVRQEAIF